VFLENREILGKPSCEYELS